MASKSGSTLDPERSCVLCCQDLDIYAVGKCDHPICFRCSTKMRVLCEQKYCAVCREELDTVVFVKKVSPFSSINTTQMQCEKRYDIYFSDGKMFSLYRRLLQHECWLCPDMRPFHTFVDLEQHMRKNHELFGCKLCLKHLKNFTYERKWYSRKDLARHRIHGDPEDTSHRGHPLCKFCDERYLDNDELLKHLRRDHYFCHFCDSEGAQEYYSDYTFLREHFRDSHFLCEEDRCSTEQFTHAFRSDIDYKAHKTSCHSKNRAEARQNRQIDIQFSYTPRHNRRAEAVVGGGDFEEVDRFNRQMRGRGGQQNKRGSWRYKREEEDREVAAAVRASVAARRQEEMGRKPALDISDHSKSRKEEARDSDEGRRPKAVPKPSAEAAGPSDSSKVTGISNGALTEEDFPAFGSAVATPLLSIAKPAPKLKEEDFPSLTAAASSSSVHSSVPPYTAGMSYTASSRSGNAFHEEDFPALVSKANPSKPLSAVGSAWAASSSKSTSKTAAPAPAPSSRASKKFAGPSSGKGSLAKAKKCLSLSEDEDDDIGVTAQEFRSAPTMIDISKLLTGNPQSNFKLSKKKRVGSEKQSTSFSSQLPEDWSTSSSLKENAKETERTPTPPATSILSDKSNTVVNGLNERKPPEKGGGAREPPGLHKTANSVPKYPLPEEDFPALVNNNILTMPPPGFSPAASAPLPPPPGLSSSSVGKPPPGFAGASSVSINAEPPIKPVKEISFCPGTYLVPEHFQQRNIDLINSIKDYLYSDESRFNEFKSHSGKFRQGLISASEYYKNCRKLLGDNFSLIFNELLVLLPDNAKQRELLAAHRELQVQEKQTPSKSSNKKNKKTAWKTDSGVPDLDYSVCLSCSQVLAPRDVAYHKKLHLEDKDFPSLQAISRIIS
ncbi:PREDICTED: zinc finger protein 598 [Nanorana parkeri]|uniref:zinc finger protein 598 n=1 Tax=Nanorana parkeri TaxID=125878 RepID=UPI000854CF23|nr:PREDICTED: zinc finger protein 598 [Nanorana parkeri]